MQSDKQRLTDLLTITELSIMNGLEPGHGEYFQMIPCRTRVLVDDFYMCQINRHDCENAFSFGIGYLCSSSERQQFSK